MATYSSLKTRYSILHRYMCGLTVFCVIVMVIGSAVAGVSMNMVAMRAGLTALCMIAAEYVLIKIWASWEDIQQGAITRVEE